MEKHKVPQGYSPADDSAGSLTPFGMTFSEKSSILHCVKLAKLRLLVVPIRLALEDTRCLNDFRVIQSAGDKLDAHRQAVLSKAARHADRGESADVAATADGIGKCQCLVQVCVQFAGGYGERSGGQNIHVIEN